MSEVINFPEKKSKKESSKIGAVIILIISALVFLPFGASAIFESFFNKRHTNTFGSYNGQKITYEPGSKFYQAASNIAQSYQNAGYQVNDQMYYYILSQAFRQTVLDYALTGAVKKSGYSVPKEAVNRAILPAFTDENGNFSQRMYNQVGQADLDKLKRNAEGQLTYARYIDDAFATSGVNGQEKIKLYGIKYSDAEEKFLAKMGEEKHSFEVAAFNTDNYPESEAVAYGKNNADKFVKYSLSVITVDDESEAKAILKQINANEITFEDAVSEKSQKYYSSADGVLTGGYTYQVEGCIDNTDDLTKITGLGKDTVSEVIRTKRGYSIFKGTGDKVAADFSNEETVKVVVSYMKQNEKGLIEDYFTKVAADFTSEAAITSFEKACAKFNVEKKDVSAFPINYGNTGVYAKTSDVEEIAAIANNASAYKTMFSLKMDEISAPFVLGNKVVVAKCSGIQFDDVEGNVEAVKGSIYEADQTSMQNTLMASDKVVDNFFATYLDMMSSGKKN
ncbi:SurA N-terminal domain-containing protein [Treponema sp.]|uniref:SurA N-terminal domain-containing protein n=1 Tax=Treponema sp. TaxID=166 RepID=UPI00298E8A30|nr:SurA N-terminal domain-containing protein [Treponema sp.]MCQ2240540.1 SurA N-terminal domain-containing protein [Treponema sp.]